MGLKLLFLFLMSAVTFTTAQYEPFPVISSSWSMWSPWSFCSSNVMIRVRACSTVRGYKCVGHNKEFQSCSSPPKRNMLDYEDPETADREMAMKQLYQDYEPETPDEAKYARNRNFHMISSTTAVPQAQRVNTTYSPTRYPSTSDFSVMNRGGTGVGVLSNEEDEYFDESARKLQQSPKPTYASVPATFEFEKYPKSSEEPTTTLFTTPSTSSTSSTSSTTSTSTTSTTTASTTTTTEIPRTDPIEKDTTTEYMEPIPETVTPDYPIPKYVDHDAFVEPQDVNFRGKYTLEDPVSEVPTTSFTTTSSTLTPEMEQEYERGRKTNNDKIIDPDNLPHSFSIGVETDQVTDEPTQSVESFSTRKSPMWEEENEPLEPITQAPSGSIPTFSIFPSTSRAGEVRRAPTTMNTHIEMPMSMLPFIPTAANKLPTTTSRSESITTEMPHHSYRQYSNVALVTSQQNFQHFPIMMNEQRASPRPYIRTIQSPSEFEHSTTRKPKVVTVEIKKKATKKKRRNRKLKKLNRLGNIRTVEILPTEYAIPVTEQMQKPMPTPFKFEMDEEKFIASKPTEPSINLVEPRPTWESEKDQRVYNENRELEARIAVLRNKVELNKRILSKMQMRDTAVTTSIATTVQPATQSKEVMLEGDTARALSWLINDMERLVDDKAKTEVSDQLSIEKIDEDSGFRIGETSVEESGRTTTTISPFPFPVPEDGFALIRSKRSVSKTVSYKNAKKIIWSDWSEWTKCQCGKQSRKRKCFKYLGSSNYAHDDQKFIPIKQTTNDIIFGEPAEFPETIEEPKPIGSEEQENASRVKRSLKCPTPQIEVRSCYSLVC